MSVTVTIIIVVECLFKAIEKLFTWLYIRVFFIDLLVLQVSYEQELDGRL